MSSRFILIIFAIGLAACSDDATTRPSSSSTGTGVSVQGPLPAAGPGESLLQLAWQPNTDGVVAGYRVYYGPSGDQATTQASDLALTATNFNAQAPSVVYNAQRDLGLVAGQSVCFRLRAYNEQGTLSAWSTPACGTI